MIFMSERRKEVMKDENNNNHNEITIKGPQFSPLLKVALKKKMKSAFEIVYLPIVIFLFPFK